MSGTSMTASRSVCESVVAVLHRRRKYELGIQIDRVFRLVTQCVRPSASRCGHHCRPDFQSSLDTFFPLRNGPEATQVVSGFLVVFDHAFLGHQPPEYCLILIRVATNDRLHRRVRFEQRGVNADLSSRSLPLTRHLQDERRLPRPLRSDNDPESAIREL